MVERLAAIYARVSTEEQAKTSGVPSTEIQVTECKKKAAVLGIPVASKESGLIVEDTHSGADLRWQGSLFMGLVRRAQRGDFTDLICLDIDRFCRGGPPAYFEQEGYFHEAGIHIHWVLNDIPKDMPFRNTIVSARADGAQWQRDKIRDASVDARKANAERGDIVPSNKPPFGWQFVEDTVRRNRRNQPMKVGFKPDPETAPILLHMYEHVAAGGSVGRLKAWLDRQGVKTPKGAPVWTMQVIRNILHNPTNWGERMSHTLKSVPLPNAVRRPVDVKQGFVRVRVPVEEQYPAKLAVFTPIEGLTKDLAMRALAELKINRSRSPQPAEAPEEERCKKGLLFRGMVRCGTCGQGMRIRPKYKGGWRYGCYHNNTAFEGQPSVLISTRTIDETVWYHACQAIRDPRYFERLIKHADAVTGESALAMASVQEKLLADKKKELENLQKQIRRLDPDDPDQRELLDYKEGDVRAALKEIANLTQALEASRLQIAALEAEKAGIVAFRDYAVAARENLETKTPFERRQILKTLKARVKVRRAGEPDRIHIQFDLRYLPGAAESLEPILLRRGRGPHDLTPLDFRLDRDPLPQASFEMLLKDDDDEGFLPLPGFPVSEEEWRGRGFTSEESYRGWIETLLAEQQRDAKRYRQWLKQTGRDFSLASYMEWAEQERDDDLDRTPDAETILSRTPAHPEGPGTVPKERPY